MRRIGLAALLTCWLALLLPLPARAGGDEIRADNIAERIGEQQWRWTVFVTGPPGDLARLACVQYTLHPTFPNPVQRICAIGDAGHPFGLTATGWGVFTLRILLQFKDGSTRELTHRLHF